MIARSDAGNPKPVGYELVDAMDFITVRVEWSGASAEDVGTSITTPIERELRGLDGLREMTSTSAEGVSSITLEFEEGTDMGVALDQVKERVALIRELPEASKEHCHQIGIFQPLDPHIDALGILFQRGSQPMTRGDWTEFAFQVVLPTNLAVCIKRNHVAAFKKGDDAIRITHGRGGSSTDHAVVFRRRAVGRIKLPPQLTSLAVKSLNV